MEMMCEQHILRKELGESHIDRPIPAILEGIRAAEIQEEKLNPPVQLFATSTGQNVLVRGAASQWCPAGTWAIAQDEPCA
jgi:hypothetical protein